MQTIPTVPPSRSKNGVYQLADALNRAKNTYLSENVKVAFDSFGTYVIQNELERCEGYKTVFFSYRARLLSNWPLLLTEMEFYATSSWMHTMIRALFT